MVNAESGRSYLPPPYTEPRWAPVPRFNMNCQGSPWDRPPDNSATCQVRQESDSNRPILSTAAAQAAAYCARCCRPSGEKGQAAAPRTPEATTDASSAVFLWMISPLTRLWKDASDRAWQGSASGPG